MNALATTPGNLFVNGRFLRGLWTRLAGEAHQQRIPSPVWTQTFAADRWHLRYPEAIGGMVSQARSEQIPENVAAETSLEVCGDAELAQSVFVGQNIEAAESANFRGDLRFSAWIFFENASIANCDAALVIGSPREPDCFDAATQNLLRATFDHIPANRWTHIGLTIDGAQFPATGLRVEIELPAAFLSDPASRVRLTNLSLARIAPGAPAERPPAIEHLLARRFFQRHDGSSINAIGRALTCNPHELFFQFTFPEMRAFPACTLPQDNAELCVFSHDGQPQSGFEYDVTFSSRTSVIIRATKLRHQLRDGYLAFRGYRSAILLDAEL